MKRLFASGLKKFSISLVLIGWAFVHANAAPARDWQPQHTWVFVVGVLRWQHSDMFNSFPQTNRRDAQLVDFFRQQGVPDRQIVYLKDSQATTRQIRNQFQSFLSKAAPGDLLVWYYTGHGYKSEDERITYFASYDASDETEGWATDSIVGDIERYFKGSYALLTADTCYSGSLADETRRQARRVSYATLASATADHLSTENWTFTEMLLAGLRGKSFADLNGDGEVSLSELAQDIREDMAFAENQRSTFVLTGNFPAQMLLAPAARKIHPLISRRVEVRSDGDWYKARVIDARGELYRVHYFGFEDSDDEWVGLRQLRTSQTTNAARLRFQTEWQTDPDALSDSANGKWRVIPRERYDNRWDQPVFQNRVRPVQNSKRDARDWN